MNKEQLLSLLSSLKFSTSEYYILSSGVLVLYGLREKAGDLDLCVSKELFEQIKSDYNLTEDKKNICDFYALSDQIEIVVNDKANFKRTFKDGYPVEDLLTILEFKKKRNAPKDQADIINIQNYLLENS